MEQHGPQGRRTADQREPCCWTSSVTTPAKPACVTSSARLPRSAASRSSSWPLESDKQKGNAVTTRNLDPSWACAASVTAWSMKAGRDRPGDRPGVDSRSAVNCCKIEATLVPGKGNLTLTGHLGDVMKESIQAAMTVVAAARSASVSKRVSTRNSIPTCTFPKAPRPRTAPRPVSQCARRWFLHSARFRCGRMWP